MKKNKIIYLSLIFIFVFLHLFSCGRKKWPSPIAKQDKFYFSHISIVHKKNIIQLTGKILGNLHNLDLIVLQLEIDKNRCVKCPFLPNYKVIYPIHSPNLKFRGNSFKLIYIPKKGRSNIFRVRLVGVNKFNTLHPVYSNIIIVKK